MQMENLACFLILERDERGGLWKYMVICGVGNGNSALESFKM